MAALRNQMFFFPKFDNVGKSVSDVLATLSTGDVLLFTKKHSGSLVLVSAKSRDGKVHIVVNSKNGTNNPYSCAAEHCLRAQFRGVFGDTDYGARLDEFAELCWNNTLTFCFEFVTASLGDHGETPLLPYLVLTCVSQCDPEGRARFAALPEAVELALRFRLILNEMWVVSAEGAAEVSRGLLELRWTGFDRDFTAYLDRTCVVKVRSMLPHDVGQGQRLEGLVVQAYRTSIDLLHGLCEKSSQLVPLQQHLVPALRAFGAKLAATPALTSFAPPDRTAPVPARELYALMAELAAGTGPTALMFAHLLVMFPEAAGGKLRKLVSLKRVWFGGGHSVIVHVHRDDVFFAYAKSKPAGASDLYRGFEVSIARAASPVPDYRAPDYPWALLGISKWKNWRYLFHTFCLRNPLTKLFHDGPGAYLAQVQRQFNIWGLPVALHTEYLAQAKAWAQWLPRQSGAKHAFLTNRRSFSYLRYLERGFYPALEQGAIVASAEERNLALIVAHFSEEAPTEVIRALTQGYCLEGPPPRVRRGQGHALMPGTAYVIRGRPPLQAEQVPHAVLLIPPAVSPDRKFDGMLRAFQNGLAKSPHAFPVLTVDRARVEASRDAVARLDAVYRPRRKFFVCMVAMQPGSGKSTFATHLREVATSMGMRAVVVSSDAFGAGRQAKAPFEEACLRELRGEADVVIYDKNVPNMAGYECALRLVAQSGVRGIVPVPVVPETFTADDAELCVARVLARPEGSHTLTKGSKIDGFASTEAFIRDVFTAACMRFVPVAAVMPDAVTLSGFFVEGQQAVLAARTAEVLQGWDRRDAKSGFDLSRAQYLALCFELARPDKELLEHALECEVSEALHATIVYYGRDAERMAEAARVLGSVDTAAPVRVRASRLGRVRGEGLTLAWASLQIEGFPGPGMHATLAAVGCPPVVARAAEVALHERRGSVDINGAQHALESIQIAPMEFEATWRLCLSSKVAT